MALGTSFEQLVEMVRDECGLSSNSSRGIDHRNYLERLIKRVYEFLCDEFDWPFLRVNDLDATKVLQAGQRYYDFPVVMGNIKNQFSCELWWGNVWLPLEYGIGAREYSAYSSDTAGVRADPVLKWKIRNERQFEVWPPPASTGALDLDAQPIPLITSPVVRFFGGKKKPTPLVLTSDKCSMDDQLVVLFVAAEVLAKMKSADAEIKLAAANKRLATLRGSYSDRRVVRVGMGENDRSNLTRGWPRVMVFPASN